MGVTAAIVGTTAVSITEQRKREKRVSREQEQLGRVESATRAHEARKSRREQVREARIRQAEVENISAAGGATGSSAAIAAEGSLQSKLGSNIGEISTALAFGGAKSDREQAVLDANRKSGLELVSGASLNLFS